MHGFVGNSPRRGMNDQRSQDMLERIADALDVDIGWFHTNPLPGPTAVPADPSAQLERIAAAFARIGNPELRATIVELVESHASLEEHRRSRSGRVGDE